MAGIEWIAHLKWLKIFLELGKSALQAVDEWRLEQFSFVPIDHHPIHFYIRIRLTLKWRTRDSLYLL